MEPPQSPANYAWPPRQPFSLTLEPPLSASSTLDKQSTLHRPHSKPAPLYPSPRLPKDSDATKSDASLFCVRASSWPVDQSEVVDTTGAGDCFIASFIYGLLKGLGVGR